MAGLPVNNDHDYTPHITLAYLEGHGEEAEIPAVEVVKQLVSIHDITVAIAGTRHTLALGKMDYEA